MLMSAARITLCVKISKPNSGVDQEVTQYQSLSRIGQITRHLFMAAALIALLASIVSPNLSQREFLAIALLVGIFQVSSSISEALLVRQAISNLHVLGVTGVPPKSSWWVFLFAPAMPLLLLGIAVAFWILNLSRSAFETTGAMLSIIWYLVLLLLIPYFLRSIYKASMARVTDMSWRNQPTGGIVFIFVGLTLSTGAIGFGKEMLPGFKLLGEQLYSLMLGLCIAGVDLAKRKMATDIAVSQTIMAMNLGITDATPMSAATPTPLHGAQMWLYIIATAALMLYGIGILLLRDLMNLGIM
jgi:hypothetical protein